MQAGRLCLERSTTKVQKDKKRFFGNFREASHGSRRDRQAEYYAHEDADKGGHNGHSPDNKQRRCFVLSCPSCPRRVRAFMSVSLSSAGPSLTIHGSYPSLHLTPCFPEIPEEPFFGERRGLNVAACHIGGTMERQIGLAEIGRASCRERG